MMYINEESWELVLNFGEEEEYLEIEGDLMEYLEELVGECNIESYEDHKYWIECRNEENCDILYEIVQDKIDRLVEF